MIRQFLSGCCEDWIRTCTWRTWQRVSKPSQKLLVVVIVISPFYKWKAAAQGNVVIWPKKHSRSPKLPAPKWGASLLGITGVFKNVGTWISHFPFTPSPSPLYVWSLPDPTASFWLPANSPFIDTIHLNTNTNIQMPKPRWAHEIITKSNCIISLGLFYLGQLLWDPDQRQDGDKVIFQISFQAEDSNDFISFWPKLRQPNLVLVPWVETWTSGALADFILQSLGAVPCTPARTTLSSSPPCSRHWQTGRERCDLVR